MEYEVEIRLTAKVIVEAKSPLDALAYAEKVPFVEISADLYDVKKRIGTVAPMGWEENQIVTIRYTDSKHTDPAHAGTA